MKRNEAIQSAESTAAKTADGGFVVTRNCHTLFSGKGWDVQCRRGRIQRQGPHTLGRSS
jgi:hypothetical protein